MTCRGCPPRLSCHFLIHTSHDLFRPVFPLRSVALPTSCPVSVSISEPLPCELTSPSDVWHFPLVLRDDLVPATLATALLGDPVCSSDSPAFNPPQPTTVTVFATPPPPAPFASSRPSSISRAPVPQDALLDVRLAAAACLPQKSARRPAARNVLAPSVFRPHVPADRRILLWTAPYSMRAHSALAAHRIPLDSQSKLFETLLGAHVPETLESYGAGLLRFHQFCDRLSIPESDRMPADRHLLSAFVADAAGSCTGKCIRNWLNGLHLWHTYNDAPWHGDEGWLPHLKRSADRAGLPFKRPPRGPVSNEHLRALRASLELDSPLGAATWAAALSAYRGCRRLGELLIRSTAKFSALRDTCRSTRVSRTAANGRVVLTIHLVWTKTTQNLGGECILTQVLGIDADLCPVWAFDNHLRINHSPPADTPLFAHRSASGWRHLTKDAFIKASVAVFNAAGLERIFGHSFRIGGSLALLLDGVAPEVIMKLGGWTSLCFLIYWRRLERILPLAITRAWDARIAEFARTHGHNVDVDALLFD
ncbi:hypothetical protein MSAN_00581400 [Mycena sanguinolenta]|uniref:DNA breaking-rejoining enzyme n=1 Tax=Mycena sanguinolenta TaxID=230812 RepID=A0A8H7DFN4_9AGAR|nr:hypothetical protein MSAN_00581400 [Mycena sanguinolenta]